MDEQSVKSVPTAALWITYVEHGTTNGWPVILSHDFPYDVHAFDEVALILSALRRATQRCNRSKTFWRRASGEGADGDDRRWPTRSSQVGPRSTPASHASTC